tara:strand:+ start:363 stop:1706 length:1344 start_codon:yes stop_codon:yes gene_type:complete
MSTFYSGQAGAATPGGISIDDTRRVFNFGDRVAELAPQQSPFFVYLSKVAKKATNDPVFKFLEQRHQWQRRNLVLGTAAAIDITVHASNGTCTNGSGNNTTLKANYDEYGKIASSEQIANFVNKDDIIAFKTDSGAVVNCIVLLEPNASGVIAGSGTADQLTCLNPTGSTETISAGAQGQVIGSAFGEGSDSPEGWEDKLYDSEGYCQIFKTAMSIFSGTSMATEYRGIKDEYKRVWQSKLMEHKMDIEHAFLFGTGASSNEQSTSIPKRYTWGIVPYTESNGKVYNMSYASSGYDAFLDAMEDFFAPESGNSGDKLVLASRKVITYLNKLGAGSFMNNTVGSSQYRLDVNSIPGAYGHSVTMVNTIFGNLHFVAEPLLRGIWEDYCVAVDLSNVAYRPLAGNGISRDTFIETNIQDNGVDGRQDQIITEAGLEISLPETHAVLKFS